MNRSRLFLLCLVLTVLSALAVAPHQQKGNKVLCYELQYAIDDYGNRIDHSNVLWASDNYIYITVTADGKKMFFSDYTGMPDQSFVTYDLKHRDNEKLIYQNVKSSVKHVFSRDFKKYNPIDVFGARDVYRLVRVSKSQVK